MPPLARKCWSIKHLFQMVFSVLGYVFIWYAQPTQKKKTLVNNKIIIFSLITTKLNVEVKHRHTINFIILLIELIIKEATVIIL